LIATPDFDFGNYGKLLSNASSSLEKLSVECEYRTSRSNSNELAGAIRSNTNLSSLRELKFKGLLFSREETIALAESLQNAKHLRSFKSITFDYCEVAESAALFQGIQNNPNFWTLEILDFNFTMMVEGRLLTVCAYVSLHSYGV
jgi:hypothetical protein